MSNFNAKWLTLVCVLLLGLGFSEAFGISGPFHEFTSASMVQPAELNNGIWLYNDDGTKTLRWVDEAGAGSLSALGGITTHSALSGLGNDDHTTYLTTTRHTSVHGAAYNDALAITADVAGNEVISDHMDDLTIHWPPPVNILTVAKDATGQYGTITSALAQASSGDTVLIFPGEYVEGALIVPPGVSLRADLQYTVTIENIVNNQNVLGLSGGNYLYGLVLRNTVDNNVIAINASDTTANSIIFDRCLIESTYTAPPYGLVKEVVEGAVAPLLMRNCTVINVDTDTGNTGGGYLIYRDNISDSLGLGNRWKGWKIENTWLIYGAGNGSERAVEMSGGGTTAFKDCFAYHRGTAGGSTTQTMIYVSGATTIEIEGLTGTFLPSTGVALRAVESDGGALVRARGCDFQWSGIGSKYDWWANAGTIIQVATSIWDPSQEGGAGEIQDLAEGDKTVYNLTVIGDGFVDGDLVVNGILTASGASLQETNILIVGDTTARTWSIDYATTDTIGNTFIENILEVDGGIYAHDRYFLDPISTYSVSLAASALTTSRLQVLQDAAGTISLNNGVLQPTLNADLLDGYEAAAFPRKAEDNAVITADTWIFSGDDISFQGGDDYGGSSGALYVNTSGDAAPRFGVTKDGYIQLGSGAAAPDITLYRSAANVLKTDDAFVADSITAMGADCEVSVFGDTTYDIDDFLTSNTANAILFGITITDAGTNTITWSTGLASVAGNLITVSAQGTPQSLTDNVRSYAYVTIDGGSTLQTSSTAPTNALVGEFAMVAWIDVYANDIEHIFQFLPGHAMLENANVLRQNGLGNLVETVDNAGAVVVAVDADGTLANDFTIATGSYWSRGLDRHTIATTFYSSTVTHDGDGITEYFHSGGSWTRGATDGVNFSQWDNGTTKTAVTSNKYYAAHIVLGEDTADDPYCAIVPPQAEHSTEQDALDEVFVFPPSPHEKSMMPAAKFVFRGSATAFGATAYFVDTRPVIGGSSNLSLSLQNLWATLTGDSGSATADLAADSFSIVGSDGIETAIAAKTMTLGLGAIVDVGESEVSNGFVIVHGDGEGGEFQLEVPAAYDDLFHFWKFDAWENDLRIFNGLFATYFRGEGNWEFPKDVSIGADDTDDDTLALGAMSFVWDEDVAQLVIGGTNLVEFSTDAETKISVSGNNNIGFYNDAGVYQLRTNTNSGVTQIRNATGAGAAPLKITAEDVDEPVLDFVATITLDTNSSLTSYTLPSNAIPVALMRVNINGYADDLWSPLFKQADLVSP